MFAFGHGASRDLEVTLSHFKMESTATPATTKAAASEILVEKLVRVEMMTAVAAAIVSPWVFSSVVFGFQLVIR